MPICLRQPMPHPDRLAAILKRLVAAVALASVWGCAGMLQRPDPLTADDVVRMSKAGTPPAEIIQRLRDTRTILPLTGSQFAKLRDQGVADEVLDHLQSAYLGSVEMDARTRGQSMYWGWGPPRPYRSFHGPLPYWYYW